MKKFLCLFLSLLMCLTCIAPAFARETGELITPATRSDIPVVWVSGDGFPLKDENGNDIANFRNLKTIFSSESEEDSTLKESILNVLYPFLVQGIIMDDFEPYYEALEKEVSEIFDKAILDGNGEPKHGTGLGQNFIDSNNRNMTQPSRGADGKYTLGNDDQRYFYDWRLDPIKVADDLHEYILAVKAVNGVEKVGLIGSCLGGNVAMAYLAKYGTEDLAGVCFTGSVSNGSEAISEALSGKFHIDLGALNRFLEDSEEYQILDGVDEFVTASLDMLDKNPAFDFIMSVARDSIYRRIAHGVTSAIALGTLFAFPNYWAAVKSEDYQDALTYVFGEPGSEKRQEYAGLIEKLDNYDVNVRQKATEILQKTNSETNLCIISKYGSQMLPICQSANLIADQFSSVNLTSLGATTTENFGRFDDKYVRDRVNEGKGKYIAPDRQIDASTCLFPDQTFFIKGIRHSHWTAYEKAIACEFFKTDRRLTVDDFEYGQFMIFDNPSYREDKSTEWNDFHKMTEENCDTYYWKNEASHDNPQNIFEKFKAFYTSLSKWLKMVFEKLKVVLNKNK